MAKFCGIIGYSEDVEKPVGSGIWVSEIVERRYKGDLIRNSRRLQNSTNLNDDITISNEISIVADPYARDHFHLMKYVGFSGTKWKVSNVQVQYPRLILTVGGVYNG